MFTFKKFSVNQDRCAMKVGTDAVLLGAWCPIDHNPYAVLDIGTGTGVLALMLAQRSNAEQIDALEIDEDAFEQAVENFETSPFADRLFCFHAGLDEFVDEPEEYDLIISNPPFFSENYFSDSEKRNQARFQESLPFEELIEASSILLSETGVFAVIIPFSEKEKFLEIAAEFGLYPFKICNVKGTIKNEPKRSLLALSKTKTTIDHQELVIEIERHLYTPEYIELTKDFYLKM